MVMRPGNGIVFNRSPLAFLLDPIHRLYRSFTLLPVGVRVMVPLEAASFMPALSMGLLCTRIAVILPFSASVSWRHAFHV